jgi:hypothetical protein
MKCNYKTVRPKHQPLPIHFKAPPDTVFDSPRIIRIKFKATAIHLNSSDYTLSCEDASVRDS